MSEAALEGEFVEEAGSALAVVQPAQASLAPVVSPQDAREAMKAYYELCEAVLSDDDYQEFEQWDPKTRTKVKKKFKKKSAVKKLQTFWGVNVTTPEAVRDDLGEGHFGFRVRAVATAKDGRTVEAWGACSTQEDRFDVTPKRDEAERDFEYRRRKALARAYHDVLSTAETRATNRAVMNIIGVGGGEVTADEISREPRSSKQPAQNDSKPMSDAQKAVMFCQRIGVSDSDRKSYIKEFYGVESFNDLNKDDLRAVCEHFKQLKQEERNAS